MEWNLGLCAIISDVHGNLNALNAVFDDLSKERIDRIICLGDTVGYGPRPLQCLNLVKKHADMVILGNHDEAVLDAPHFFNEMAAASVYWTKGKLEGSRRKEDYLRFLDELPRSKEIGEALFVHGSPCDPTSEYIFPRTIYDLQAMSANFNKVGKVAFMGHTHMGGVFKEVKGKGKVPEFHAALDLLNTTFKIDGDEKLMVNVGSVGQPRDHDRRACYVLVDGETCRYRRVEYDFEETGKQLQRVQQLKNFPWLWERLVEGR